MIIGQSIYNVPVLSYLLETETFSIVEYQLKCCSVANDAAPDCCMVWSGAACCRQGHRGMDGCTPVWELMDNTLNICSEPRTSLFDWFYCFITLLRLRFQCTDFNFSAHKTVYAECIYVFYQNLVFVAECHVDCWQRLQWRSAVMNFYAKD